MPKVSRIVHFIITPHSPRNVMWWLFHQMMNLRVIIWLCRSLSQPRLIRRLSHRSKIRMAFLVMNPAMWRFDALYYRLSKDDRFELLLIAAPRVNQCREATFREQEEIMNFFAQKGRSVIKGIDEATGKCISLRELQVDIVFYTQPYDGLLLPPLEYWHNILSSLICYTPYSFQLSKVSWNWDNALQNHAWRHHLPLPYHKELCQWASRIKARNAVPVGYFFEEEYRDALANRVLLDKVWRGDTRKRVIWAPHHSIVPGAENKISAFLEICDDMVRLREKYRDKVVFAFKPHPMLRDNLYKHWGKEKTEAYYADWANAENSFLDDGAFLPLFAGSDAMIHCSGSFIVDYIYTGKPVQYVYCKDRNVPDYGEIGDAALNAHYPAHNSADIEQFIEGVVLGGNDPMKTQRENVYQTYLKSPNGKTFSENVVEDILKGLGRL